MAASASPNIIVLGASAGGFKPLCEIVSGLPAGLQAAVFVCLHIAPDRPSSLPKILSSYGPLPARHAKDGEPIRMATIYVASPDKHLLINKQRVRVFRGPQENRFRPAIDAMFRSAARAHGSRVIGAVLTGSLNDGTVGLQAIKECGGITVVQDPEDAEQPSMPTHALRFVEIDHAVPVREMAALLVRLVAKGKSSRARSVPKAVDVEANIAEQLMDTKEFLDNVESIGTRTTYACPQCNGSIWQIGKDDPPRFRCHVGHSFTAENFWAEQSQHLENALWSAIRIMEEKVTFARQFAERMRANKLPQVAERYEKHAKLIDKELGIIRDLVVAGRGTTRNVMED